MPAVWVPRGEQWRGGEQGFRAESHTQCCYCVYIVADRPPRAVTSVRIFGPLGEAACTTEPCAMHLALAGSMSPHHTVDAPVRTAVLRLNQMHMRMGCVDNVVCDRWCVATQVPVNCERSESEGGLCDRYATACWIDRASS